MITAKDIEAAQSAFKHEVEAYLLNHSIPKTTLGIEALGDPSFVDHIRKGRSPSFKTIERVREYMRQPPKEKVTAKGV